MRKCKVLVHGVIAGELTEHDNPKEYVFIYSPEYKGEPVSLLMPVRSEEYRSEHLFPYFANILSEGENRSIQASVLRKDKDDDFGILLETAQFDTVGAVTVVPENN